VVRGPGNGAAMLVVSVVAIEEQAPSETWGSGGGGRQPDDLGLRQVRGRPPTSHRCRMRTPISMNRGLRTKRVVWSEGD
jgi:hypothetical protein